VSGTIPTRDQRLLALRSGGRCAMCRRLLVEERTSLDREVIIGEMAHIKGENPGSARYDPSMADAERNQYDNLIYLCVEHHTIIDGQGNTYSVEQLHRIKAEHEAWVRGRLEEEMLGVTFTELEFLTKLLLQSPQPVSSTLTLTPPLRKIEKNELLDVADSIMLGMVRIGQVREFIIRASALDLSFGERLKMGFVKEYKRLRDDKGLTGVDLFDRLLAFSSRGSHDFRTQATGLAILVYFFEACEVFEP